MQWASGDPAQTLVFTHTLTNHSNITDTFTLIAFSGEGWATALSLDPLTPPFAATPVVMSITIPADALAGTTVTTTLLASGSAGSDIAQAVITVEVYRLYLLLLLRGSP